MALPVAAQELVLDALDKISADPELLVERLPLFPDALYDDDFLWTGRGTTSSLSPNATASGKRFA